MERGEISIDHKEIAKRQVQLNLAREEEWVEHFQPAGIVVITTQPVGTGPRTPNTVPFSSYPLPDQHRALLVDSNREPEEGIFFPATPENLAAIGFEMASGAVLIKQGFPYRLTPFSRLIILSEEAGEALFY